MGTTRYPADAEARARGLDGVRALAALSVLAFHTWLYRVGAVGPPRQDALTDRVLFEASLGLICFFVLSGYLLYRAFARAALVADGSVDVRSFARRRVARILPAYYLNVAGCIALFSAVGLTHILPPAGQLPLFAVFGQNYSLETIMKINAVHWTLGVEAAFYVALPVVGFAALWFARGRAARQAALLIAIVALSLVWNAAARRQGWGDVAAKALPAYAGVFAIGMLVAVWGERRRTSAARPLTGPCTAVLVMAGVALVALEAVWHQGWAASPLRIALSKLPAAVGFGLVIAAVVEGRGTAVRWLSARPLAAVGVISYGVYLWHLPLILVVRELGLLPQAFALRFPVVLALTLAAAALSWRTVERPAIKWAASSDRGRLRRLEPREVQAAP